MVSYLLDFNRIPHLSTIISKNFKLDAPLMLDHLKEMNKLFICTLFNGQSAVPKHIFLFLYLEAVSAGSCLLEIRREGFSVLHIIHANATVSILYASQTGLKKFSLFLIYSATIIVIPNIPSLIHDPECKLFSKIVVYIKL